MAKRLIYSPQGDPVEVEAVDAREYVEHLGYSREKPEAAQQESQESKENASQGADNTESKGEQPRPNKKPPSGSKPTPAPSGRRDD